MRTDEKRKTASSSSTARAAARSAFKHSAHKPVPAAPPEEIERSRRLAKSALEAALEKKALMPVLLDVSGFGTYTDFIGIVSGRSDRHVQAVADQVQEVMERDHGLRVLGVEGSAGGQWVLIDFGGFVVHVFYHPLREFYDLEGLWLDAPRLELDVPAEALLPPQEAY